MTGRTLVITPAPTANGDLHLGHLAGPFLAADVYTRHLRSQGRQALLATGFQDTSTFVVTTASRRGVSPAQLVARSAEQIAATLRAAGIAVHGYSGDDARFTGWVAGFLGELHAAGRLESRTLKFPYSTRTGRFLVDGFVTGGCPHCLADGCAGLCESCGHLVPAGELISPRSAQDPEDPVSLREAEVLVLPLERYRDRLREHVRTYQHTMRPHMAQAMSAMLAEPLPDFPITYPIDWGIPAPFAPVAGQVINPNAEALAWSMHCTALAAESDGVSGLGEDGLWRAGSETQVVYFLGFDNIFPFALAVPAMAMAFDGRYILPAHYLTNEFYELHHRKFSTSRGHVVAGQELAARVPRDLIRFHLAATSPEYQRTSFSDDALRQITGARLVQPWNRIAHQIDRWAGHRWLPVTDGSRRDAARMTERIATAFELPGFSLTRAAEMIAEHLARLAERRPGTAAEAGGLYVQTLALVRVAAPILIDLADEVLGPEPRPEPPSAGTVVPRRLPRLDQVRAA